MSPESWPNLEHGTINLWRLKKMFSSPPPPPKSPIMIHGTLQRNCVTRTPGSNLASRSHQPMPYWSAEGNRERECLNIPCMLPPSGPGNRL